MKSKLLISVFVGAMALISCSGDEGASGSEKQGTATANTVANLYVEGMMCEAACGGKIKKELAEMACVSNATIEFDEDQKLDLAVVEFDNTACSLDDMVNTVHAIMDGAYQVKKVEVVSETPAEVNDDEDEEEASAYNYNNAFSLSSLFKSVTMILELR